MTTRRASARLLRDDTRLPAVQGVYWVSTTLLAPGDPEEQRAAVVVAVPAAPNGTVVVVTRSAADGFGVEHEADLALGLSSAGRFSRRHGVQASAWTVSDVTAAGTLDDETFAAVVRRFGP